MVSYFSIMIVAINDHYDEYGETVLRRPRTKNMGMNSFFGDCLYEQVGPANHFMHALTNPFDWEELGQVLLRVYVGQGRYGRPPYDPVLVYKMLFLSCLYGISERNVS